MRSVALLLALLVPGSVFASQASNVVPDPHAVAVPFVVPQGVTVASGQPALQAINTGAGNAFEAYTAKATHLLGDLGSINTNSPILGSILSLSADHSTNGSGLSYNTPGNYFGSSVLSLRDAKGFVEVFSNIDSSAADFYGSGLYMGEDSSHYGRIKFVRFANQAAEQMELLCYVPQQGGRWFFADYYGGFNSTTLDTHKNGICWEWGSRDTGGDPRMTIGWKWRINVSSVNTMPIHSEWYDVNNNPIMLLMHAGGLQIPGTGNSLTLGSASNGAGNIVPGQDNTGAIGTSSQRWATVRAAVVTTGDLGFEDEKCAICGKPFNVGDDVVWRIHKQAGGVSYAVPIHQKEGVR